MKLHKRKKKSRVCSRPRKKKKLSFLHCETFDYISSRGLIRLLTCEQRRSELISPSAEHAPSHIHFDSPPSSGRTDDSSSAGVATTSTSSSPSPTPPLRTSPAPPSRPRSHSSPGTGSRSVIRRHVSPGTFFGFVVVRLLASRVSSHILLTSIAESDPEDKRDAITAQESGSATESTPTWLDQALEGVNENDDEESASSTTLLCVYITLYWHPRTFSSTLLPIQKKVVPGLYHCLSPLAGQRKGVHVAAPPVVISQKDTNNENVLFWLEVQFISTSMTVLFSVDE
jgi:hypothetical protein